MIDIETKPIPETYLKVLHQHVVVAGRQSIQIQKFRLRRHGKVSLFPAMSLNRESKCQRLTSARAAERSVPDLEPLRDQPHHELSEATFRIDTLSMAPRKCAQREERTIWTNLYMTHNTKTFMARLWPA